MGSAHSGSVRPASPCEFREFMLVDPMTTLAMTGATTIVAAMATSAWGATRAGAARLFRRRGGSLQAIEAQLDGDAAVVEQDEDTDGARQDLIGPWKRRLVTLLREDPEAETDLRALIDKVSQQLPQAQQSWVQNNIAGHGGQVFAAQGGNVIVHQTPPGQSQPPKPATGELGDGTK
jgi:hypothetical protein